MDEEEDVAEFLMDCDDAESIEMDISNGSNASNASKTEHTKMNIESKDEEEAEEEVIFDYELDIELNDDIKKMLIIKSKKWEEMDGDEKLFYFIHRELFDMILTRGLAFSNLGEYKLAFYDSYLCTLLYPKDITAWNNRAFAWYQLAKYKKCILDCNFALKYLKHKKLFTKGLLIGNRGLAETKLSLYNKAINDLNICLKYSPQSRLAREALHQIWKQFTNAIYDGCKRVNINNYNSIDIPFVIAKIIADYGVGIDFDIIPQCHQSTIVYQ